MNPKRKKQLAEKIINEAVQKRTLYLAGMITEGEYYKKILKENLEASPEEDGIHITGFPSEEIDSLFLTLDPQVHQEMTSEGPVGSKGVIVDKETGTKIYWSFGYQ